MGISREKKISGQNPVAHMGEPLPRDSQRATHLNSRENFFFEKSSGQNPPLDYIGEPLPYHSQRAVPFLRALKERRIAGSESWSQSIPGWTPQVSETGGALWCLVVPETCGALPTLVRGHHSDGALCSVEVRATCCLEPINPRLQASPQTL